MRNDNEAKVIRSFYQADIIRQPLRGGYPILQFVPSLNTGTLFEPLGDQSFSLRHAASPGMPSARAGLVDNEKKKPADAAPRGRALRSSANARLARLNNA